MPQRYFDKFPIVAYSNSAAVDITARAVVVNAIYNNPALYYPYDVKPYERPDNIADRYYSDQYKEWILRLTNKVVDPYYDWYMDQETFHAFVARKYGSIAAAQTKVKHYQNNWYSNSSPISATTYDALPADAKRFWEPVLENGQNVSTPREYNRVRQDWQLSTNKVVQYSTANAAGFIVDEIVDVTFNGANSSRGQVAFANSTHLIIQHTVGTVSANVTGTCTITGRESSNATAFTAVSVLADNIGADQSGYWSAVSYYEYESNVNERNKSIVVLDAGYSEQVSRELKDAMRA